MKHSMVFLHYNVSITLVLGSKLRMLTFTPDSNEIKDKSFFIISKVMVEGSAQFSTYKLEDTMISLFWKNPNGISKSHDSSPNLQLKNVHKFWQLFGSN